MLQQTQKEPTASTKTQQCWGYTYPKRSNAIIWGDLGNEFEQPFFMQKKLSYRCFYEGKRRGWKFSISRMSASPVGLHSLVLFWGRGWFLKPGGRCHLEDHSPGPPPQPGCPTAFLRIDSADPVHISWPEISQATVLQLPSLAPLELHFLRIKSEHAQNN